MHGMSGNPDERIFPFENLNILRVGWVRAHCWAARRGRSGPNVNWTIRAGAKRHPNPCLPIVGTRQQVNKHFIIYGPYSVYQREKQHSTMKMLTCRATPSCFANVSYPKDIKEWSTRFKKLLSLKKCCRVATKKSKSTFWFR